MKRSLVLFTAAVLMAGSASTGTAIARERADRASMSANQIADQYAARTARIKADLRLSEEQTKNWPGFETAMVEMGKRSADRQLAMQNESKAQTDGRASIDSKKQGSEVNVIEQMRRQAKYLGERSADRKAIADAAEPLYVSLDTAQKQRFSEVLVGLTRGPDRD